MSNPEGRRPFGAPPPVPGAAPNAPVKVGKVFGTAELDFFTAGESIESGTIALEPPTELRWTSSPLDRLQAAWRRMPGGLRGRTAVGIGAGTLVMLGLWAALSGGSSPPAATASAGAAPQAASKVAAQAPQHETTTAETPPMTDSALQRREARKPAATVSQHRRRRTTDATPPKSATPPSRTAPPPVRNSASVTNSGSASSSRWTQPASRSSHPRMDLMGRWGSRR